MKNWFTLGRTAGGPSNYGPLMGKFSGDGPLVTIVATTIAVPLLVAVVLLTFFCRKDRILPTIKTISCAMVGSCLVASLFVCSWSKTAGKVTTEVNITSKVPTVVRTGFDAGLFWVKIQMEIPGVLKPDRVCEDFNLRSVKYLHIQYLKGLREGWPFPVLFMASLLGGEDNSWEGVVGKCFYRASQAASPLVYASLYIWCLWCSACKCAPSHTETMTVLFGSFLVACSFIYFYVIKYQCHPVKLPGGQTLVISAGWMVILNCSIGVCLIVFGTLSRLVRKQSPSKTTNLILVKDSRSSYDTGLNLVKPEGNRSLKPHNFFVTSGGSGVHMSVEDEECAIEGDRMERNEAKYSSVESISPTALSNMFVK